MTLHEIAHEHAVSIVDLDRPELREAAAADPAAFVAGSTPVRIDEFQKVPITLDAIRVELNRDLRPGRFLITGSARFDGVESTHRLVVGDVFYADNGTEHVAHPIGPSRVLVIERQGWI